MTADIETLLRLSAESLLGCSQASSLDISFIAEMMQETVKEPDWTEMGRENYNHADWLRKQWSKRSSVVARKRVQTWLDIYRRNT